MTDSDLAWACRARLDETQSFLAIFEDAVFSRIAEPARSVLADLAAANRDHAPALQLVAAAARDALANLDNGGTIAEAEAAADACAEQVGKMLATGNVVTLADAGGKDRVKG